MKAWLLASLVASTFAQQLQGIDRDAGKSRAEIGHIVVRSGTAPQIQQLKPRFQDFNPNVKRTKVRYGPYSLPSIKSTTPMSLLTGEAGTMTTISMLMTKPCSTCGLVTAQAGLEYADGTVADNSNGAWLHHIVMLANGPGRRDNVCGTWVLPGERFFSSGNERTPTAFGDVLQRRLKSVFQLSPADSFSAQLELMNLVSTPKSVYLTVDFEYIPGSLPQGYKLAKAMWLDVTGCGIASVNPPRGKRAFTLNSRSWTSPWNGQLLGVGGHAHDGGLEVNIYRNSQVICKSKASYGIGSGHSHKARSAMIAPRDGPQGPQSADGKAHIQTMSTCSDLGAIRKGDRVHIDAVYDFNKREGNKSKTGSYNAVMGIAILYGAADA